MFLKSLQISQESIFVGVFFNNVAGPQNWIFIKRRLQHRFFLWILGIIQKLFCVEDLWTANSETPVRLFKKTFLQNIFSGYFWQFQVSSLQICKKGDSSQDVFLWICKTFKNIFWQNTSRWLLLVFICESWEVFQITSFRAPLY